MKYGGYHPLESIVLVGYNPLSAKHHRIRVIYDSSYHLSMEEWGSRGACVAASLSPGEEIRIHGTSLLACSLTIVAKIVPCEISDSFAGVLEFCVSCWYRREEEGEWVR